MSDGYCEAADSMSVHPPAELVDMTSAQEILALRLELDEIRRERNTLLAKAAAVRNDLAAQLAVAIRERDGAVALMEAATEMLQRYRSLEDAK